MQRPDEQDEKGTPNVGSLEPQVRPGRFLTEPDRVLNIPEASVFDDEDGVRRRREKRKFIDAHGEWLAKWRWNLWVTMTFPEPLTLERAQAAARSWLRLHGREAYAYSAYELGEHFGRGHIHLLVGGKSNGGTYHRSPEPCERCRVTPCSCAIEKLIWRHQGRDYPIMGWNWVYKDMLITMRHVRLYDHRLVARDPRHGAAGYVSKYTFDVPEHGEIIGAPQKPRRRKRGRGGRNRDV